MPTSKPTRRDLLVVVGELQNIIGHMGSVYANDRASDTADRMIELGKRGMDLAILARSFDPPIEGQWPRADRAKETK